MSRSAAMHPRVPKKFAGVPLAACLLCWSSMTNAAPAVSSESFLDVTTANLYDQTNSAASSSLSHQGVGTYGYAASSIGFDGVGGRLDAKALVVAANDPFKVPSSSPLMYEARTTSHYDEGFGIQWPPGSACGTVDSCVGGRVSASLSQDGTFSSGGGSNTQLVYQLVSSQSSYYFSFVLTTDNPSDRSTWAKASLTYRDVSNSSNDYVRDVPVAVWCNRDGWGCGFQYSVDFMTTVGGFNEILDISAQTYGGWYGGKATFVDTSNSFHAALRSSDAYFVSTSDTGRTIGAPVPEPETYALLMAGLGMLGVVAQRRQQV